MSNAFWAWTLTVQETSYDPYEWGGRETFCSSEQGVAARIFASREEAEAHFHAWFEGRQYWDPWEEAVLNDEDAYLHYSLEVHTVSV